MPVTLRRFIIRALDRPGGRLLLSRIATRHLRRRAKADITVFFDDVWIHRVGTHAFLDSPSFDYFGDSCDRWNGQAAELQRNTEYYWFRTYQPKAGDVIVDVGAGHGEDALLFSSAVGPSGRVLAIEAHPAAFFRLSKFCSLNRLTNVKPLHNAIVDRSCTVYIDSGEDWEANAVRLDAGATPASAVPVQGRTLDDLFEAENLTTIDYLKINIEGAETLALQGLRRFAPKVERMTVACHDFRADRGDGETFRTRATVIRTLREMGFALMLRDDDPRPAVRDHVHAFRPR